MYFSKETFTFLKDLKKHNNREWFQENKQRYETKVRDPILQFISDFGQKLDKISPRYVADPRPNGGSLMRIYRDIRFSEDKSPYRTDIGISFWHEDAGKSAWAPGYYLGVSLEGGFAGGGLWHPDADNLAKVRNAIVNNEAAWQKVRKSKLEMGGAALSRPPRGFNPEHRFIEDIKRKDFIVSVQYTQEQLCSPGFINDCAKTFKSMAPLMEFLCNATGYAWT